MKLLRESDRRGVSLARRRGERSRCDQIGRVAGAPKVQCTRERSQAFRIVGGCGWKASGGRQERMKDGVKRSRMKGGSTSEWAATVRENSRRVIRGDEVSSSRSRRKRDSVGSDMFGLYRRAASARVGKKAAQVARNL